MGRTPCCQKVGLKKGRWTAEEDDILAKYIQANGEGSWRSLPKNAGLLRCGKSCRLRWINYLKAGLKRGNITAEEEEIIINLHASLGNRWSLIASNLPGRTDNEIKNYWNSNLSRKIQTFWRPSSEKPGPVLMPDVAGGGEAGETRKKEAVITHGYAAPLLKKKKKKSKTTHIQTDGNNVIDVHVNGPVGDSDIVVDSVSTEEIYEQNQNVVGNVDDGDAVPLPATPRIEKETRTSATTGSVEDFLDMGIAEQEETGMLCSEVKETKLSGPSEGIDEEMLCFGDIMGNDPKGVWSASANLMAGVTETDVLAKTDDLNSATTNGEAVELRSCPSVNSFFEESKFDLDLDWDWSWESVIQGPDHDHDHQQQQCEENDQEALSWEWEKSCKSEEETDNEKQSAMIAWLLS